MEIFNMKMLNKLLVVIFSTLVIGCSSTVYVIEPSDNYEIYQGRKIIELEKDGLSLSLNFEHYSENNTYFFLYAENQGDKKVTLSPENISMTIISSNDINLSGKTFPAVNPEEKLSELNIYEHELDETYETHRELNCLFATFGVVASIVDNNSETDPVDEGGEWLEEMEEDRYEYENTKESIQQEREFWKNEVLRLTELKNEESIGGLVIFPMVKSATRLVISIKTEESIFKFYFKQFEKEI